MVEVGLEGGGVIEKMGVVETKGSDNGLAVGDDKKGEIKWFMSPGK